YRGHAGSPARAALHRDLQAEFCGREPHRRRRLDRLRTCEGGHTGWVYAARDGWKPAHHPADDDEELSLRFRARLLAYRHAWRTARRVGRDTDPSRARSEGV